MTRVRRAVPIVLLVLCLAVPVAAPWAASPAPRSGGVLTLAQFEDPPVGFAIHETPTIGTIWPAQPCFNNLVTFDPAKPVETMDTVVPDLAEKWSWQDNYRNLVFFLRKNVKWHDGHPFTSRDVKYTFDMIREAPDAPPAKLRMNPRKDWYKNVEAIETPDAWTVIFRLKRPQPSVLLMLASGQSPVYPAHVPPAEMRARCIGTGPFKLKEWRRGEYVEYVRNPDYFVKGRPYLDGLRYVVIAERSTREAALQTGRVDVAFPTDLTPALVEQLRAAVPKMAVTIVTAGTADNLLLNATRAPFNDVQVRRALNFAVDRRAYVQAVGHGGAVVGTTMLPPPYGTWGLVEKEMVRLPGYGDQVAHKARARQLLGQAGFTPAHPLKVEVTTRAIPSYVDFASFVVDELRRVGIEASIRQVDTVQWYGALARKEYQVAANVSGFGLDDPDANFYENYACDSMRNYTGYCSQEVMKLMDQQSHELDRAKRLGLVHQIQRKLEEDAARPVMGWRLNYFARWPYVKNLVPHDTLYSYGRMQDVWLEK